MANVRPPSGLGRETGYDTTAMLPEATSDATRVRTKLDGRDVAVVEVHSLRKLRNGGEGVHDGTARAPMKCAAIRVFQVCRME